MALTFDDLPVHETKPPDVTRLEIVETIIRSLKREGITHACGFANTGIPVDDGSASATQLFQRWLEAGYELGNHGARHLNLHRHGAADYIRDVDEAAHVLHSEFPNSGRGFFRYPYLAEGETAEKQREVRDALFARNLTIARVTANFGDWIWNQTYTEALAAHQPQHVPTLESSYLHQAALSLDLSCRYSQLLFGRRVPLVLLLHAGVFSARMLGSLLKLYRDHGVEFISLGQALADPAYSLPSETFVESGYTWFHQLMKTRGWGHLLPKKIPEAAIRPLRAYIAASPAANPAIVYA